MTALPGQLQRIDVDAGPVEDPLIAFLRDHNALPFTAESVAAYKATQVARAKPKIWQRRSLVEPVSNALIRSFPAPLMVAILSGMMFTTGVLSSGPVEHLWQSVVLATVTALGIASTVLVFSINEHKVFDDAVWQNVPYWSYDRSVPLPVQLLAEKIAHRFNSTLFVDTLTQDSVVIDPFLVVRHNGVDHYIAVWDEPTFNGERSA